VDVSARNHPRHDKAAHRSLAVAQQVNGPGGNLQQRGARHRRHDQKLLDLAMIGRRRIDLGDTVLLPLNCKNCPFSAPTKLLTEMDGCPRESQSELHHA